MDPATLAKLLKYAPKIASGWDWLTGKKGPSRSGSMSKLEKNYLSGLKLQANQGMSAAQVDQTMGTTTRTMGIETDIAKTNVMGNAYNQGLEGSAVVAEQLKDVDLAGSAEVAATARKVAADNIKIQESAKSKLGAYGIQKSNQQYSEALNHYANQEGRLSSVLDTVSGWGSDYLTGLETEAEHEELKSKEWWDKLTAAEKAEIMYGGGI